MICPKCGMEIADEAKFCEYCGAPIDAPAVEAEPVAQDQATVEAAPAKPAKEKLVAGLLGIFLGAFGIHKFYLGYKKPAVIMLLVSLLTFGIGASVMSIIGLIEGILYLVKSDEEFDATYVQNEKGWF